MCPQRVRFFKVVSAPNEWIKQCDSRVVCCLSLTNIYNTLIHLETFLFVCFKTSSLAQPLPNNHTWQTNCMWGI